MYNDDCSHIWGRAGICLGITIYFPSMPLIPIIWKKFYPNKYRIYMKGDGESPSLLLVCAGVGGGSVFLILNFIMPLLFC